MVGLVRAARVGIFPDQESGSISVLAEVDHMSTVHASPFRCACPRVWVWITGGALSSAGGYTCTEIAVHVGRQTGGGEGGEKKVASKSPQAMISASLKSPFQKIPIASSPTLVPLALVPSLCPGTPAPTCISEGLHRPRSGGNDPHALGKIIDAPTIIASSATRAALDDGQAGKGRRVPLRPVSA